MDTRSLIISLLLSAYERLPRLEGISKRGEGEKRKKKKEKGRETLLEKRSTSQDPVLHIEIRKKKKRKKKKKRRK